MLRQPRYAALTVLMAIVALACVGAGTWQIARFEQKRSENEHLRANDHAAAVAVGRLLPLVGSGAAPSRDQVELRTIRATGTYDAGAQALVRNRTVGGDDGFLLLTPLRTAGGVLLVVRGFVKDPDSGPAPTPPAPPAGTVTIEARAVLSESRHDLADQLPPHQVESINAGDQARRLRAPTYDGYGELKAKQPGTAGLVAIPAPSLANPAGGAVEPQHFAYVIQWYLFAALALAAPFVMARAETRQPRDAIDFDALSDPANIQDEPSEQERRAAKLADRYGRPVG